MSNSNSNKNGNTKGSTQKKKQRSAAAMARRAAKRNTQKAAKKAAKEEKEKKTETVLEMFPDILGIVASRGFMPNVKKTTLLSKNFSASLKKVPLFQNVDRSTIYPNGATLLNKYLIEENWDEAMKIIEQGVPKKILEQKLQGSDATTPLVFAVMKDKFPFFKKLLEKGSNPNTEVIAYHRMPILHYVATYYEDENVSIKYVNELLAHKADINAFDSVGYTVVDATTRQFKNKVTKILIDAGAYLEKPNKKGFTPLLTAINSKNLEVLQYMLEKGNIHINKQTGANDLWPLKLAVLTSTKEIVREILEYEPEPDVDQKDDEGNTALHYAVLTKNYDKVKMLIHAGANSKIKNKEGITAVDLAKASFGETNPKAIEAYTLLEE